ncbi:hypothetical protein ACLOJK_031552 [Asimina triloba]
MGKNVTYLFSNAYMLADRCFLQLRSCMSILCNGKMSVWLIRLLKPATEFGTLSNQMKTCDYKTASQHVDRLDAVMKDSLQQDQQIQKLAAELDAVNQSLSQADLQRRQKSALYEKQGQLQEQLKSITGLSFAGKEPSYFGNTRRAWGDSLDLAPPPVDGEWLPKSAVYALVDLMVVIFGRPKGLFKECGRRIQSGLHVIQDELVKLGITNATKEGGQFIYAEVDLQHSAIWMAGVYLMLLMQFLENKVAVELTRSEFVEAQEALVQMKSWFVRFPTILQGCESIIEMLRGQYAHSLGCLSEAAFHFIEAAKALDLIGPVFRIMDSFVGAREKTSVLFAYGLLLMKQHNLQEARIRLATGLRITHQHLGNIQLVSQYLTVLGTLALALHDTGQAREILKSSLTLAKTLYDIPTQIWVLSVLTALYRELGESGNEMENLEYERKKADDLQKRILDAQSSIHHLDLIDTRRIQVKQLHEIDMKRAIAGPSTKVNLDIPESVGLFTPPPTLTSARLRDIDANRRGKKKI